MPNSDNYKPAVGRSWRVGAVLACLLAFVLFLRPQCCDATPAVQREECKTNLARIYQALTNYVKLHNALPYDDAGHLRIDQLGSDLHVRCPGNPNDSGYFITKDLTVDDFNGNGPERIIVWEAPWNHRSVADEDAIGFVLFSSGKVRMSDKFGADYEQWVNSRKDDSQRLSQ